MSLIALTTGFALATSGSETVAPSLAKAIAHALAIFPPPPVMMTDLCSKRIFKYLYLNQ
jgi:hypothetical protein